MRHTKIPSAHRIVTDLRLLGSHAGGLAGAGATITATLLRQPGSYTSDSWLYPSRTLHLSPPACLFSVQFSAVPVQCAPLAVTGSPSVFDHALHTESVWGATAVGGPRCVWSTSAFCRPRHFLWRTSASNGRSRRVGMTRPRLVAYTPSARGCRLPQPSRAACVCGGSRAVRVARALSRPSRCSRALPPPSVELPLVVGCRHAAWLGGDSLAALGSPRAAAPPATDAACAEDSIPEPSPPSWRSPLTATMHPLVAVAKAVLSLGAEVLLFWEAQRLVLSFITPSPREQVRRSEERLLSSSVSSPYEHAFVPTCVGDLHVLIVGDRSKPPLLVLHGHSMSAVFFHLNFDDLVAQGWCVYALDLPGWGRSARPVFRGRTAEDSLDFFLTPTLQALAGLGISSGFGLMAHSLGAYLALELAFALPPGRVTKMVLVSPAAITSRLALGRAIYFSLPPSIVARRGGLLGLSFYRWKYPLESSYEPTRDLTWQLATQVPASGDAAVRPMVRIHRERRIVRGRNGRERPSVRRVGVVTRPLLGELERRGAKGALPIDIQIVCGETDSSMPVEDVHTLYAVMQRLRYRVTLHVVKGADHCPFFEEPARFIEAIAAFRPEPEVESEGSSDVLAAEGAVAVAADSMGGPVESWRGSPAESTRTHARSRSRSWSQSRAEPYGQDV